MRTTSGITVKCWDDFVAQLPANPGRRKTVLQPLADLAEVQYRTVCRWTEPPFALRGRQLLAVRYFLEAKGYQVEELRKLSPEVYQLGKIIAYGLMEIERARATLGYKSVDDVYRLLRGGSAPGRDKVQLIEQILEQRGTREEFVDLRPEGHTPSVSPPNGAITKEQATTMFAHQVHAMAPLVQVLTSATTTPEERVKVRNAVGSENLFRLSTMLNRLCSETAYKEIQS